MAKSQEVPAFAIGTHNTTGVKDALPSDASLLWRNIPGVYVWGGSEGYQVRTASHPLGRVAVLGACFANQERLDGTLSEALEQQNPELLTHLPGAYVTILHEQDKLTVLRDVAGVFPVYFTGTTDGVTISSDPTVVAGDRRLTPNMAQTIANLTLLAPNEGSLGANASCFEGVDRLMGGQALSVGQAGKPTVYTYEALLSDKSLTRESAAAGLRDALREAVQSRIESGIAVSANLSGGVDSSSVVGLALESMWQGSLPVFFMDNPGQEAGDKKFFNLYVSHDARLQPNLFDMESLPHVTGELPTDPEALSTVAHPARQMFLESYYSEVLNAGAGKLHLTGNGGDEIAAVGPYYLPDLLRSGRVGRFIKEGREWARIYNTSPYRMWSAMGKLAMRGVKGILQDAAERAGTEKSTRAGDPVDAISFWRPDDTALSWLTPEARQLLKEYLLDRSRAIGMSAAQSIGNFIGKERMYAAGSDQGLEMHAVPPGVSLQSPFLDHNVVRAAAAADATLKGSPYEFKLLLREALKGVVPDDILNRPSKGIYGHVSRDRHFEALRTLGDLLDDSILVALGIIDPEPIRRELGRLEMIPPNTMWALTQILTTERWLRSLNLPEVSDVALVRQASSGQQEEGPRNGELFVADEKYSIPAHVYFVGAADGSLLAFNQKTDQYHPLTVTQSNVLRLLAYTGNVQQTIEQLRDVYPTISAEQLTGDVLGIVKTLQDVGVIAPGIGDAQRILPSKKAPRFVSEEFHTAHAEAGDRVSRTKRGLATTALIGTELINRVAPQRRRSLLLSLQRRATKPASQEEAIEILRAVQSSKYIGRIACLQASYAAALALALRRKKAEWHIGASFSPLDIHAWIEAEGRPVRTEKDGRVMGSYQSFFG